MTFIAVSLADPEAAMRALNLERLAPIQASATITAKAAPIEEIPWIVDIDGDGEGDFANPTDGAVRGFDAFGAGRFGARRDAGKRVHHGVDYVAAAGALVRAPIAGKVTRVGYAYENDAVFRYVEVSNPDSHLRARVLYVTPSVKTGQRLMAGDVLGAAQNITKRYPGITNHVHVELRDGRRRLLDASAYLPDTPIQMANTAGGSAG